MYTLVLVIALVINGKPALTTVQLPGFSNQAKCEKEAKRLAKIHYQGDAFHTGNKVTWSCSQPD